MNREGEAVARCTAERLIRRLGLRGVKLGKVVRTTIRDNKAPRPKDGANRRFQAERQPVVDVRLHTCVDLPTLEWVAWRNNHRLLEPIGYIPPAEAEANYYCQLASQAPTLAA